MASACALHSAGTRWELRGDVLANAIVAVVMVVRAVHSSVRGGLRSEDHRGETEVGDL